MTRLRLSGVSESARAAEAEHAPGTSSSFEELPIEFTGWLPVFGNFGNCGHHPQFDHTDSPPPGYRFVRSVPSSSQPVAPRSTLARWIGAVGAGAGKLVMLCVRPPLSVVRNAVRYGPIQSITVLWAVIRLLWRCLQDGARPGAAIKFLRSRHFPSQVLVPRHSRLLFLTSIPYTYDQHPWVIEIEDATTLFYPFLHNGRTATVDVHASPYFRPVRTLLESERCRAILTHIRSTAETLPRLFRSPRIGAKVFHVPLGVKIPPRWQKHEAAAEHLDLLFTCSWHQDPESFYLRGGLEVLDAFGILQSRYPHLRLTLRTRLPHNLPHHYRSIVEGCWVRVIDRFLPREHLDDLMRQSHIYLLPAARIHVVSLLQAMSFGHVVVASDGWGIEEYVQHGRTGLIVEGRYGKVAWMDEEVGLLREDYTDMHTSDLTVVDGLVREIAGIVEDRARRRHIGQMARLEVETYYSLDDWNDRLKGALDQALGKAA